MARAMGTIFQGASFGSCHYPPPPPPTVPWPSCASPFSERPDQAIPALLTKPGGLAFWQTLLARTQSCPAQGAVPWPSHAPHAVPTVLTKLGGIPCQNTKSPSPGTSHGLLGPLRRQRGPSRPPMHSLPSWEASRSGEATWPGEQHRGLLGPLRSQSLTQLKEERLWPSCFPSSQGAEAMAQKSPSPHCNQRCVFRLPLAEVMAQRNLPVYNILPPFTAFSHPVYSLPPFYSLLSLLSFTGLALTAAPPSQHSLPPPLFPMCMGST